MSAPTTDERSEDGVGVPRLVRLGWNPVSFAADCSFSYDPGSPDAYDLGDICSICGLDYCEECQCPGPTQDGVEYATFGGILYGRFIEANSQDEEPL